MTIKEAMISGRAAGNTVQENLWLLEGATGLSSNQLRLAEECTELSQSAAAVFTDMLEQRRRNIPIQYILGRWEFMGLPMICRPEVLIPRGDTEILVTEAISFIKDHMRRLGQVVTESNHLNAIPHNIKNSYNVLDLCTGSGCIGIALKHFCPSANVTAADISPSALTLAKENAQLNDVQITFVESDLFRNIEGMFHCITVNPPYIPTYEINTLSQEVRKEPLLALDGGKDGLDFYRGIIPSCGKYLRPGGAVFFEIGNTQGEAVLEMLCKQGFKNVNIIQDIENRDRVVRGDLYV